MSSQIYKECICEKCGGSGEIESVDGQEIKRIRIAAGYRTYEIAEALGYSISYINEIERGIKPMSEKIAAKILAIASVKKKRTVRRSGRVE